MRSFLAQFSTVKKNHAEAIVRWLQVPYNPSSPALAPQTGRTQRVGWLREDSGRYGEGTARCGSTEQGRRWKGREWRVLDDDRWQLNSSDGLS